ncbi:NPC intracellular cholesterol transporter 1 homolog 1b-like [Trichoplusia ni]|uniref:NPC intracellular cholesterol transporter 1 homolog 1b-like n=1 Tax=Trichoplusia ni TaxID=7111 RepID=A0A7E5VQW2_TRINI|nr:NPC intracellular cholesterol transporter 1 homolog 1b-like [Trichoplusia ni]
MKFVTAFVLFLSLWSGATARCRMYGECYNVDGLDKPCPADIEPVQLISGIEDEEEAKEIVSILKNRCPSFVQDEEGNDLPDDQIYTCCSPDQIIKLSEGLTFAEGVLGRCPTCLRNFARQVCEMTCAVDQSRFMDVYTLKGTNDIEYVNEIDYRVHSDFMLGAHASCAGVIVPQSGLPAINLMCGNAVVCDADAWFGFIGDADANYMTPLQINFLRKNSTEDTMNKRALPCNETFDEDLPCSCVDCGAVCPIGTEPVVLDICTVLSVHCIGFSVGVVFFVITTIIFIFLAFKDRRSSLINKSKESKEGKPDVNKLTLMFQKIFGTIGRISASHPVIVIMVTTWIGFSMFFGLLSLNLTANPLELWSAPDSRSRHELEYFNSRFGPFYRAAQVFLTFDLDPFEVNNVTYGPAFRLEALEELVRLEKAIIDIGRDNGGVVLEDVCYAPLTVRGQKTTLDQCAIMSATVYLGNDQYDINNATYLGIIQNCINNHYALNCLASWGGGSIPELTFGGYDGNEILSATTLVINIPITNYLLAEDLQPVLEWEAKFLELLEHYNENLKPDYVVVSYGTERSIEDEIQRVSVAEAVPIAISYVLMFIYVVLALGNVRSFKTWFIDSKFTVAVCSVVVVILAIFCSMGTMGYANVTLTLLAINVIPFFILSIGIDNVFLMINTLHDIKSNLKSLEGFNENLSTDKKTKMVFEEMMRRVGPSMFVSSVTQITCFAVGSLTNFPAVVTFAIFASISLGYLFVFQVTTVVAILAIDYKRAAQNRFDILCCIRKKILDDESPLHSETSYKGITQRLMEPYSKFLLNWRVKIIVAILFMAMVSISVMLIPQLEIGLDQEYSLPRDSYVYTYLQSVNSLLKLGPPVFFVLKSGLNFSDPVHQNVICGGQLCSDDSLTTQIFLASQHSEITYIASSSNSWLDDFIDWSNLYGGCCKYNTTNNGFCQSTDNSTECSYCVIEKSDYANGQLRPNKESFQRYIPFFLQDAPTVDCNKGGLASYSASVNYELNADGLASVQDTNFMAYHTSLATSKDYITAIKYAYEISDNITSAIKLHTGLDVEVFPYSVFFVYFEQYLTMWGDTFTTISYSFIGALVLNLLASGFNLLTTFAVMFTAILVVLNMMGIMYIWSIPLNAVSCVNLIVSIGIAVEFCSHIAYAYSTSRLQGRDRVADAIQSVGATVITGITFTNIPIIVLAFSYTQLIEVFFFRMFFSLVILGFLHGMVFFPVFLCYLDSTFKQ